jgi:hypothetical protein
MCYSKHEHMSWANLVKGAINQVKDSGASTAIQTWLAREMADYGEVLDFKIDSRARTAELHVMLKGERERLTVNIDGYEMVSEGGADYIVVKRAHASREWVNAVIRNFLIGKKQKIPAQYSSMAKMLLGG